MPSYILRTIDPALWARVKARAAEDRIPLRTMMLALIELYAAGKITVATTVTTTQRS